MTQSFGEWNKYNLGYTGKQAYEAGQQSRQAEVDELQKRIDDALKILMDWHDQSYRDDSDQLIGEIEDILKGTNNEQ